jgi:hypothetical protein
MELQQVQERRSLSARSQGHSQNGERGMIAVHYGITGCGVFKAGVQN